MQLTPKSAYLVSHFAVHYGHVHVTFARIIILIERDGAMQSGWPIPYFQLTESLWRSDNTPIPHAWSLQSYSGLFALIIDWVFFLYVAHAILWVNRLLSWGGIKC